MSLNLKGLFTHKTPQAHQTLVLYGRDFMMTKTHGILFSDGQEIELKLWVIPPQNIHHI